MKRVLVIGGSRGIGLEVVRRAVRSGYAVRALARSADRIPGSGPNLDKRVGSAIEVDSVAAVLPGVDAVVMNWACGSGLRRYSGPSGCSRQRPALWCRQWNVPA